MPTRAASEIRTMLAAACVALCAGFAGPAAAEPPAFPDFSAKRVKPPVPGDGPRITVQVPPRANPAVPPPPGGATPVAGGTRITPEATVPADIRMRDWFWAEVSPDLADSGPGRLEPALAALARDPDGLGPRLSALQAVAAAHGPQIMLHSVGTRVSPALALAVIAVESAGRTDAVSDAGAQGLMQLMPATAEAFGVADVFDPGQNIAAGIAFLDRLMARFDNDPILVLAAYNAGEGAVAAASGVPPFAETRSYVPAVLAGFRDARALCVTPPQLLSDGCVLRRP